MVAKIRASASTGRHWRRMNEANPGRTATSSRAPATTWRIATTLAGPRAPNASAAFAARPLRDAPPVAVQVIWRRHDPHPATHAAAGLYRSGPGATGKPRGAAGAAPRGPGLR
jgi:hypothetical protein